jgi:hypothetical protein
MIPVFDYGSITTEHKKVAEEIIKILEQFNQPMLGELIRQKFEIAPINSYNLNDSVFLKYCEKANIKTTVQGFLVEGEDLTAVKYPIVSLSDDIRNLNEFINIIQNEKL